MVNLNMSILSKKEYDDCDYDLAISLINHEIANGVRQIIIVTKRDEEENITNLEMSARIEELFSRLYENKIRKEIKIYQADCVKISRENIKECLAGNFRCINNSRYMLIDLGGIITKERLDMIYELTLVGIIPIIVHPERCEEIIDDIVNIQGLKDCGCLFQLDINSLVGNYGDEIKKVAQRLLKEKQYDFVGSEVSESLSRQNRYNYSKLSKSEKDMFYKNGLKVIMNEEIKNNIQIKNGKRKKKKKKNLFGFMI